MKRDRYPPATRDHRSGARYRRRQIGQAAGYCCRPSMGTCSGLRLTAACQGRAQPGAADPRGGAVNPYASGEGKAAPCATRPRARPAARTAPPSGQGRGWAQRFTLGSGAGGLDDHWGPLRRPPVPMLHVCALNVRGVAPRPVAAWALPFTNSTIWFADTRSSRGIRSGRQAGAAQIMMVSRPQIMMVSRPRVSGVVNPKAAKFMIDALVEMLARVGRSIHLTVG